MQNEGVLEFGKVLEIEECESGNEASRKCAIVVRCATLQDQAKANENALMNKMASETCGAKAEKWGLPIRLGRIRYSFDRKALMVLFTADKRVDFREMVKDLAAELHTRIEMKQIGVRDEAGHIGGMGQ